MNSLPGLAAEMLALEAETFEVEDYADPGQILGDEACATCSSTCSTWTGSTSC